MQSSTMDKTEAEKMMGNQSSATSFSSTLFSSSSSTRSISFMARSFIVAVRSIGYTNLINLYKAPALTNP